MLILLFSAVTDVLRSKIPNFFIVIGLLCGAVYRVMEWKEGAFWGAVLGMVLLPGLLFPLFMIKAMGAGDLKLLMVTGLYLGPGDNFKLFAVAVAAGACIGVWNLLLKGGIRERLLRPVRYFRTLWLSLSAGGGIPEYDQSGEPWQKVHFALPILIGGILVMGGVV